VGTVVPSEDISSVGLDVTSELGLVRRPCEAPALFFVCRLNFRLGVC
jgi:hypothetical protein